MKKFLLLITGLAAGFANSAQAEVSLAKAAELGCHRIERLVTLKRIDAAFLEKFYALKIEKLDQNSGAAFRFTGFQPIASDGSSRQVEILMDANGKASTHQVIDGAEGVSPTWPQTDPVTLMEYALHYVLENYKKPEVAPFFNNLTEGTLTQIEGANGQLVAQAVFRSSETGKSLFVTQGLDGSFQSAEVK